MGEFGLHFQEQKDSLIAYLRAIKSDDKVGIFFDADPDGQTSAKLISEILVRSGRNVVVTRAIGNDLRTIEEIVEKDGLTHAIALDLPKFNEDQERWQAVARQASLASIDHHKKGKGKQGEIIEALEKKSKDPNSNIVYVNPHSMDKPEDYKGDPSKWNTSKLIWDLTESGRALDESADISDLDWVAAIGVVFDYSFREERDWLAGIYSRHSFFMPDDDYVFYGEGFGRIQHLMNCANRSTDKDAVQQVYRFLDTVENPRDLLTKLEAMPQIKDIETKIKSYVVGRVPEEDCEGIVIVDLDDGELDLANPVAGMLTQEYPEIYVLVSRDAGEGKRKISLRCEAIGRGDEKAKEYKGCADLITEISKGAWGGGHDAAAGGKVPVDNYEAFLVDLKEVINQLDIQ